MDNLNICGIRTVMCAKCGRVTNIDNCVIAPSSSRYAGKHICVYCIDAPVSSGSVMRPTEFKFPSGGSGATM